MADDSAVEEKLRPDEDVAIEEGAELSRGEVDADQVEFPAYEDDRAGGRDRRLLANFVIRRVDGVVDGVPDVGFVVRNLEREKKERLGIGRYRRWWVTREQVLQILVDLQREFLLRESFLYFRPMKVADVAGRLLAVRKKLGSPEAARKRVEEAKRNTKVVLPWSPIPLWLDTLFEYAAGVNDSKQVSQFAVLHHLAQLVEHESRDEPVSDSELAETINSFLPAEDYALLNADSIVGYRKKLLIPSSRERKRIYGGESGGEG